MTKTHEQVGNMNDLGKFVIGAVVVLDTKLVRSHQGIGHVVGLESNCMNEVVVRVRWAPKYNTATLKCNDAEEYATHPSNLTVLS